MTAHRGTVIRFCEFTGDSKFAWDESGHKKKCGWIGIMDNCLNPAHYKRQLGHSAEGWRTCCRECTQPIQVKELK